MRLRAPVTRGYFFLIGALRLVNAASPRNIDQKKISSGTQGILELVSFESFGEESFHCSVLLCMFCREVGLAVGLKALYIIFSSSDNSFQPSDWFTESRFPAIIPAFVLFMNK